MLTGDGLEVCKFIFEYSLKLCKICMLNFKVEIQGYLTELLLEETQLASL